MVITAPTIGSARGNPSETPMAPNQHRQACPAVDASMMSVCDKGRAADFLAYPQAENRHSLIADEADDRCPNNRP